MVALPPSVAGALASFQAALARDFGARVRRFVRFGSVARGTSSPESDVDVLVLLDRHTRRDEARIIDLGADELTQRGVLVSPSVMTEEAFALLGTRERRLALDINREGIPL